MDKAQCVAVSAGSCAVVYAPIPGDFERTGEIADGLSSRSLRVSVVGGQRGTGGPRGLGCQPGGRIPSLLPSASRGREQVAVLGLVPRQGLLVGRSGAWCPTSSPAL